jgi:acetyl-CoA acetyltransferase
MTITTQTGWMRNKLGAGVWENRGKVAVAGVGQSPIDRRWESGNLEKSLGAYSVLAAKRALEDAGVGVDQVDGIVSAPGPIGDNWAPRPFFAAPYDTEDGLTKVTGEWLARGLGVDPAKLKFCGNEPPYIGLAWGYAIEAIATGKCSTVLLLYPTGNLEGRYHQQTETKVRGPMKFTNLHGWTGGSTYAYQFNEYTRRYGGSREDLGRLVVHLRRNGLLVPWGYYTVYNPKPLTLEEYMAGRFINEPLCLYDADLPVNSAGCYLLTTAERAKDMKQKPVYIWNHAEHLAQHRSMVQTLDEAQDWCEQSAKKTLEGAGLSIADIDVFNPYDGYTQFTQYWLEAFGWHGVKKGEALQFYRGDMSVGGSHPFMSSGGNNGTGRTRTAIYTDTIEQLRGTAGKRQLKLKAETGIAGCVLPQTNGHVVFGKHKP